MFHQPVFAQFYDPDGGEHPDIHDPQVQVHAERPFACGPVNRTHLAEDLEESFQEPGLVHEPSYGSCRDEDLEHEDGGAVVEFRADGQGRVNDEEPKRYQWREVVGDVVGVHGIGQQNSQKIQSNQNLACYQANDITEER